MITGAGEEIVSKLDEPARRANQQQYRGMSGGQIDTLIDLLDRLRYPDLEEKEGRK